MKLELKENMYIRTKDGIIDKVIIDYNGHCASPNCECKHISCAKNYYDEDKIVKASYNIIDILEVGDYVNDGKVIEVDFDVEEKYIIIDKAQDGLKTILRNNDIKSIVTKEQFESIKYSLEG